MPDIPSGRSPLDKPFRQSGTIRSRDPTVDDYDENDDHLGSLPDESFGFGRNRSLTNIAGKMKADKMLGLDSDAKLCSLFLISGVGPTDASKWVPADNDSSRVQPVPDSLGFYWRPEILGTAFSGPATEAFQKATEQGKKMKKEMWTGIMKPPMPGTKGAYVPDAGPMGAEKLIGKSMKYAHPRDVEVINTSLMPNTTAHYFSFTLPSHSSTADAARQRLNSVQATEQVSVTSLDQTSTIDPRQRGSLSQQAQITYYGATLTVWTSAEPERARQLSDIRSQLKKKNELDSILRAPITGPLDSEDHLQAGGGGTATAVAIAAKRNKRILPWMPYRDASNTDYEASDTETIRSGLSDGGAGRRPAWSPFGADSLGLRSTTGATTGHGHGHGNGKGHGTRGYKGTMESSEIGIGPLKAGEGDTFWKPYALTLVSRFPIHDTMIDYIRTSWSMYQKSARRNLYQMCKILNHPVPRPGEIYRLTVGKKSDADEITIETAFPGAVDFEKGLIKTDFQLWPLFQAIDVDAILTAIEIALSNSGKVVFTSQYTAMLCLAVHTLRYMVDMRGWSGVSVPVVHARDVSFIIEDPGPYIVGLPMECRYMLSPPADACVIDLDTNTVTLKKPPRGVITPRARRDKVKYKIFQALGQQYPIERSIPTELKIAFPNNRFRPFHRIFYEGETRPHFLGERLRAPIWWKANEVMGVFDKIMLEKHKKPSLIQRLVKSGLNRTEAQLTVGEQLVKQMMRKRAMHYVEARDDLEQKVARINQRLMQLMQEGEKYRRQFLTFEQQADLLSEEALRLKNLIEREQKEADRLQQLTQRQMKDNEDLDARLKATEDARATAMRQLSDMQESLHDLEREKDAIMTIIEDQISSAIGGLQADSTTTDVPGSPLSQITALSSRSHPLGSPTSPTSKMGGRYTCRPGTGDTATSQMTGMTSKTEAISILGLARKGYAPAASGINGIGNGHLNGKTDTDKNKDKRASVDTAVMFGPERGRAGKEELAERIANIQAKLDFALGNVCRRRSESLSTIHQVQQAGLELDTQAASEKVNGNANGAEAKGNDILGLDTGSGTKQESQSHPAPSPIIPSRSSSRPPVPLKLDPAATGDIARAESPTRSITPQGKPLLVNQPLSRSNSAHRSISEVIRPGSRLRIRQKRSDVSTDDISQDRIRPSSPLPQSHSKALTTSSSINSEGEIVITPTQSTILSSSHQQVQEQEHEYRDPSPILRDMKVVHLDMSRRSSDASDLSMGMEKQGGGGSDGEGSGSDRRLSTISTTTVTFGPV